MPSKRSRLVPSVLAAAVAVVPACQNMDRVERPEERRGGGREEAAVGGTVLREGPGVEDLSDGPTPGRLTADLARREIAEIEELRGQERLDRIDRFVADYPRAQILYQLHVLAGEAHQNLDRPARAADAFERAVMLTTTDLLGLPVYEPGLPYRVGWARYLAGDTELGMDWLVRTTFVNDEPRVEQGLRFLYAEQGGDPGGFERWLRERRRELAVVAPDFELPTLEGGSVRLSELPGRVKIVNFWSPT